MPGWADRQQDLVRLAGLQLFFVGGAPRSGTTWLQQMLDSHPDISCRGEGIFFKEFAAPLDGLLTQRARAISAKNTGIFKAFAGYPLPNEDDREFLLGSGVLLWLLRQTGDKICHAVGEKTPENVFFFPRLKALFPGAKHIGIARDPRDVLTSAWHFFGKPAPGEDPTAAKMEFVRRALPSLSQGAQAMLALGKAYPTDCAVVTYEALLNDPGPELARLFAFLGVSDADAVVADCVAHTSFAAMTANRAPGESGDGSFLRKGVAGDWRSTLTPEMNDMILREVGWMFRHFGWRA